MAFFALLSPVQYPQTWDKFQVSGKFSPGVIRPGGIEGFDRGNEWDIKKGKGTLGGTVTFVQRPNVKGSITIHLGYLSLGSTPQQQFDALGDFLPTLQYDPTKKDIQAVDLYHPSFVTLGNFGVIKVVVENISPLKFEGNGIYSVTFSFVEYFPPPKASAVSTPKFSKGSTWFGDDEGLTGETSKAPNRAVPDPIGDRNEKLIEELTKKAEQP